MGVFTDAGKNVLLNAIEGAGWYAALFSGEPGNGGTEQTNFENPRLALNGALAVGASGEVTSNADLTWTANGANTVTWIGFYDAAADGTLVAKDELTDPRSLVANDVLTVEAGALDFDLSA